MKNSGLSYQWTTVIMTVMCVAGILIAAKISPSDSILPDNTSPTSSYPFPSAIEFEESPYYSINWITEDNWPKRRFLLIRAKEFHAEYGCLPYLLRALPDVEKEKYTIISKEFLSTTPLSPAPGRIDSLLLEVRRPENPDKGYP